MPDPRRYSDEDIQAIIQRALEQQGAAKGDLTHSDLLGIGEQVGVSTEALEHAAHDVLEARRTTEATQRVTSARKRWLAAHAAVFALMNALLFTVNALTTPGEWWFLFSAVLWGLALSAHAAFALGAGSESAPASSPKVASGRAHSCASLKQRPQRRSPPKKPPKRWQRIARRARS